MFWWDFLVGDTPELFVAVVVIVGAHRDLERNRTLQRDAAIVVLPVLAVLSRSARRWVARCGSPSEVSQAAGNS